LREAEAERDSLREQLDRVQRAEVERLAQAAGLAVAADVWSFGASLDTLRGEDGSVDAATVQGAVDAILKDRPGLRVSKRCHHRCRPGCRGLGLDESAAGRLECTFEAGCAMNKSRPTGWDVK
jgi:hypothetical protein